MKRSTIFRNLSVITAALFMLVLGACGSDDKNNNAPGAEGHLAFSDDSREIVSGYDNSSKTVSFEANSYWKVDVEQPCDWIAVSPSSGQSGRTTVRINLSRNDSENIRQALLTFTCGKEVTSFTVIQDRVGGDGSGIGGGVSAVINSSDIPSWDKFFPNSEHGATILRRDARFSFARYAESDHFFVFWDRAFGDDPNAPSVPANMRVNIDDLLAKAEHFFQTNVNRLGMTTVGQGKSYLDQYKMQIYILYQEEWLATGAGYDNRIGALWVNPSTCQPVGSTIAHEIGHSFQYQVYCDQLLQGVIADEWSMSAGFRYGFGPGGKENGCSYWEQCAQWQAQLDYPEEMFGYHVPVWKKNCHRIFYHEWMRYASYWLQHYWVNKRGIEAYAAIWQESRFPEDPIQTYTRLYNGGDMQATYDELYDYAAHMVYYDLDNVRQYADPYMQGDYSTELLRRDDGSYLVAYASAPGTTGFNVIPLEARPGAAVSVAIEAIAPGSKLDPRDSGKLHDGDENVIGTTSVYNRQSNTSSNYRFGFVTVSGGKPSYSPMTRTAESATATFTVPASADELYLVVCATPDVYNQVGWDDREDNDEQWPYAFTVSGTDVYGYSEPATTTYEKVSDNLLKGDVAIDVAAEGNSYYVTMLDIADADVLSFFGLDYARFRSALVEPWTGQKQTPAEGRIVLLSRQSDGSLADVPTANTGYWLDRNGNVVEWGNGQLVFFETSGMALSLGQLPGALHSGERFELRPTLIYTTGGTQKRVDLTIVYNVR